jgi:hypothetical protein
MLGETRVICFSLYVCKTINSFALTQKVKDSWRVVNHRDIIPTIPRLMGYCHVNQPVFLAAGVPTNSLVSFNLMLQTHLVF